MSPANATFQWANWTFEPSEWRLMKVGSGPVSLPNKSLGLLGLLLERAPGLVSKDDILAIVWGGAAVEEGNIAFHIAALRKALDARGERSCIETVRGRGYRFISPVTRIAHPAEEVAAAEGSAALPALAPAAVLAPAGPEAGWQASTPATPVTLAERRVRRWRPAQALAVLLACGASLTGWAAVAGVPQTVREAFGLPGDGSAMPALLARHLGVAAMSRTEANTEALTLTLRAREAWQLRTPPSVQQAVALYERAIALDPSFAPAYAGLADCYNLTMSGLPVDVRARNAKANAAHALLLDPELAEAHTSLAFSLYKFEWKWAEAESAFRRAIAADPSYALAHHWYGEMLGILGRYDEAITELRRAQALNPNSLPILIDLAGPLLRSGRIVEARAVVEGAAAINPMFHGVPGRMADVLAAEGRERESLEEEWRALILRGASLESVEELRAAYRAGGRPGVLRVEIARLEKDGPSRFEVPARATFLAARYARLGDREKTLHWIRIAIDRREDIALHLPTYPEYHWLRGDPEFKRQLARLQIGPRPDDLDRPEPARQ